MHPKTYIVFFKKEKTILYCPNGSSCLLSGMPVLPFLEPPALDQGPYFRARPPTNH